MEWGSLGSQRVGWGLVVVGVWMLRVKVVVL